MSRTSSAPRQEQVQRESTELLHGQNEILKLIAQGTPLAATLEALIRVIERQSPDVLGSILVLDPDGIHLRHGAAPNLPESYTKLIDGEAIGPCAGSCGTAAYLRESVIVEDIATDPLWVDYRDLAVKHGLRACWSTPVFDEQRRVLGTFALYFRNPCPPTDRHLKQVAMATYTAAIAICKHRESEALLTAMTQLNEAQRIAKFGSYDWLPGTDAVNRSEELCRIFGIRREEFAPTFEAYLQRVHPADRANTQRTIQESVREHKPFEFQERIVCPDGSIRELLSQGGWIFDEARKTFKLVGICQDITASKAAERDKAQLEEQLRQSQKMESIGRLAGGIAHDFNNILNVIIGYGELLSGNLPHPGCEYVAEINKAALRAAGLTRQLLAFSRRQVLQPTVINLNTLVEDMSNMMSRVIGEHIELRIDREPQLGKVKADRGQIEQVLLNLVVNARDAMPEGGNIVIKTGNTTLDENYSSVPAGNYVTLAVADTGCGMDAETLSHIFEPFFTTKVPGEGTGLGLSVVYGVVKQSGSHIAVDSHPGKGTTFKVYFPRV